MPNIILKNHSSPCGDLLLGAFAGQLCLCEWLSPTRKFTLERLQKNLHAGTEFSSYALLERASAELNEYFTRKRKNFDIPLLFVGTDFQKAVWQALLAIPYGTTRSYAQQATAIGRPEAVRAVAAANKANALSIFVPCHRVIGHNGTLTGYGGGLPAKHYLLELENPGLF